MLAQMLHERHGRCSYHSYGARNVVDPERPLHAQPQVQPDEEDHDRPRDGNGRSDDRRRFAIVRRVHVRGVRHGESTADNGPTRRENAEGGTGVALMKTKSQASAKEGNVHTFG